MSIDLVAAVRSHYGGLLGRPSDVREVDLGDRKLEIALFADAPTKGAHTLATVGLASRFGQELLFFCYSRQLWRDAPRLLAAIGSEMLKGGAGLQRGQVLGPAGPIAPGSTLDAFYVCEPGYLPESFDPLVVADGSHVHFFWLLPIQKEESTWIATHDSEEFRFEQILEELDPDLLDLGRSAIPLPGPLV
jgi:hypothetical protein